MPKKIKRGKGKIWDAIKSGASKTNKFLRDTKIISKVSGALDGFVPGMGMLHYASDKLGYGKGKKLVNRGGLRTRLERGMLP